METFDAAQGEALNQAVEAAVSDWAGVTKPWMFGFPTYKAEGTIFALVANDGVVLTRLPDDDHAKLDDRFATGPFQAGDQTIESWVHVTLGADDLDGLVPFLRASHNAALGESRAVPPPDTEE